MFDPLTLSIYESEDRTSWRERMEKQEEKISFGSHYSGDFNDFIAHSVSVHENDHFVIHTGSEMGLLTTILCQIRYAARLGLWFDKLRTNTINEEQVRLISRLDLLFRLLFSYVPDIDQESAVFLLNEFYKEHFGVQSPVFVTNNPKHPASPDKMLTYHNLLEASAIFTQMTQADYYKVDGKMFANYLKYILEIDPDTYAYLPSASLNEVNRYLPAAIMAVRMSIDSRVPVIGSPFIEPIDWEDLHPGYRFQKTLGAAKVVIEHHGLSLDLFLGKPPEFMYRLELLNTIYLDIRRTIQANYKLRFWDDSQIMDYRPDLNSLERSMTEPARKSTDSLFQGTPSVVLLHMFDAFSNNKQALQESPVTHLCGFGFQPYDSSSPEVSQEMKKLQQRRKWQKHFATFSIFNKQVDSVYLETNPTLFLNAFNLFLRSMALSMLLNGNHPETIVKHINKNYFIGEGEVDRLFKEIIFEGLSTGLKISFHS